jgi:hypothetical protein
MLCRLAGGGGLHVALRAGPGEPLVLGAAHLLDHARNNR